MKSIIVGTAGHIDHGKTALVKALTGIDADRLEEEKRRGITIDLGFAHMELPAPNGEKLQLGFVDVPGHERFVRNMLAGVGGIDLVLLVIAADESIKPQTREHFEILQLLGVQRGITVLTKSDTVDSETLDVVRLEVEEFLRGTFLEAPSSPIIPVSSLTGAGLEDLKRAMIAAAANVAPRDSKALARLPIDRVFTIKGFGTVVTGTLISGTIHREEELEVFPTGRRVRVRGVQVHGQTTDAALAGQRTALNLAGVTTDDLSRGMVLAPVSTFEPTSRIDVKLRLLPSAPRSLKTKARVHFHCQSMERVSEIIFYTRSEITPEAAKSAGFAPPKYPMQIKPGEEMFVQLRLSDPALLLPGDRFIVRQFSPMVTIGGGSVSQNKAASQVIDAGLYFDYLAKVTDPSREVALKTLVAGRGLRGISVGEAVMRTGWSSTEIASIAAKSQGVERLTDLMVSQGLKGHLLPKLIVSRLESFHHKNPLVSGMSKEELRGQLPEVAQEVFAIVLDEMTKVRQVEVVGELVHLPGRGVVMKDEEAESKKQIEDAFATAGLKVPALHEVLAGVKVDKARAQKIVTLLLRDKILVKISDELVFHRTALEQVRRQVIARKAQSPTIDVAAFKEMTGVSRKYAIPLLEYLDRERVTKRVGDARLIL
jgi:selenocysteine-specific elongation factor